MKGEKRNARIILNVPSSLRDKLKEKANIIGVSLNSYCTFILNGINPDALK